MKTKFKFFLAFFLAALNTLASSTDFKKYRDLVDKRISDLSEQCFISDTGSAPLPPTWFEKLSKESKKCIQKKVLSESSESMFLRAKIISKCYIGWKTKDELEGLKQWYREEKLDSIRNDSDKLELMNLNEATQDTSKLKIVLDMEKKVQFLEEDCLKKYGNVLNENEIKLAQPQFVDYSTNLIARMKIYNSCSDKSDKIIQKLESETKDLPKEIFDPSAKGLKKNLALGTWNWNFQKKKGNVKTLGDKFRKDLESEIDRQEEEDHNNKKK